jgi:hypothetical protein
MADETTQPQISAPAPAPVQAEPVAPDVTSNAPAVPAATPMAGPAAPPTAASQVSDLSAQYAQQVAKTRADAQAPPPSAPVPHARLLGMVQGLADGLSALGTSLATRGKEGGAPEVQQLQAERQNQKLQADQAAQAKRSEQVRLDMIGADTTLAQMNNIHLLSTMKNEQETHDFEMKKGVPALQSANIGVVDQSTKALADIQAQVDSGAITPADANAAKAKIQAQSGAAAPVAGAPTQATAPTDQYSPTTLSKWKNEADVAAPLYPNDPEVQKFAAVLQNPQTVAPDALRQAYVGLKNRTQALGAGAAAQKVQLTDAAEALQNAQKTAAQAIYQRQVPKNAQGQPTQDFDTWQASAKKAAEQAITQGDTSQLGVLVADGLMTIPQIAMSRQLDKPGFQKLIAAADEEAKRNGAPEVVINGRPTGHYFNANAATQQYQYVSEFNNPNSKVQQAIGSGNTFLEHAGDLLDVSREYHNTNIPLLNTPINKIASKFGDAEYNRLLAAIQPVQTEYANALAAGFVPSADDKKNADTLLSTSSTPSQVEYATHQMAHSVLRRLEQQDEAYQTHTGVSYPNMITPGARVAATKLGLDTSKFQSGGNFAGVKQVTTPGNTGATSHQVGDTVTLKNGQTVVIKVINPDGTFKY